MIRLFIVNFKDDENYGNFAERNDYALYICFFTNFPDYLAIRGIKES